MDQEAKKRRPVARAFLSNLGVDLPWWQKIRLLLRNNWLKIKNLQNCCSHSGEPGC